MVNVRKKVILGLILITAGVGAAYAWNSLPSSRRWEQGYSQISEGDTEQKVIEILGRPTEINHCYGPRYSGSSEIWQKCAKEYWYIAFLQEWVYVIDKDGRVVVKCHSVSQ